MFPTLILKARDIAQRRTLNRCLDAQGRNCERNYDDCLLNPCPATLSCLDGINTVSCLPPATDAVPPATAVENITLDSAARVPALALNVTSPAEKYTGAFPPSQAGRRNDCWLVLACSRCRVCLVSPLWSKSHVDSKLPWSFNVSVCLSRGVRPALSSNGCKGEVAAGSRTSAT